MHICQGEIFLVFDKPTKKIKDNTLLLNISGGSVHARNQNSEPHVPYNIDEKSLVLVEGKGVTRLSKHLLGPMGVWGKCIQDGKVFPVLAKDGQPTE